MESYFSNERRQLQDDLTLARSEVAQLQDTLIKERLVAASNLLKQMTNASCDVAFLVGWIGDLNLKVSNW